MITIQKPYIQNNDNSARLCANIVQDNSEKTMYFEVPSEYGDYLCDEVADAFVVGLIDYAFALGEDIVSEAPVSERLLYQLQVYYLKTMPVVRPKHCKPINITAPAYTGKIESAGAVAGSASGGVDSYYTIARHTDSVSKRYRLTHLLIANQFNFYKDEEDTRNRFEKVVASAQPIADNYGLKLIPLFTNHNDFLFDGFVQEYSMRICSYAFALQKLIQTYYISSGVSFDQFDYSGHDSDSYDIFNLSAASTDNLSFYSSGGEVSRTQKIAFFAEDTFIQKNLKVCNYDDGHNCSKCEKCLRTMLSLDIIGRLDGFCDSFDTKEFQKRKRGYLSTVYSGRLESSSDFISAIKRYNYRVPFYCKLYGKTVLFLKWKIKEALKKIKWLRKLYFAMKIDFLIYGKEKATLYRYGTENEIE